jgi:hypothetical protein
MSIKKKKLFIELFQEELRLGNHYEYKEEKLCNVLFHETLNSKP